MFYSQFILAKKGPLGTIWIAAHLERKLRKNQVADIDIGVSVDSILSPDVPIALRLSSHLLLGVARIYSRKVNYLFDDCSEALLKIKQAFRSTAVDLPPEQSKAPYHSITLPETFDLDDFELPDNEIYQGNYVDHHVSSREQITLQDTLDGVAYSTTRFGLDERFGDADTSGLDLDEELFMDKVRTYGDAGASADPQIAIQTTALKEVDHEGMMTNLVPMINGLGEDVDHMDDAQAPRTPGLLKEPNLSNAEETSACDDHFESEDHQLTALAVKQKMENISSQTDSHYGDKHADDLSLLNDTNSHSVVHMPSENGHCPVDLDIKPLEISSATEATVEHISPDLASASGPYTPLDNSVRETSQVPDLPNNIVETFDFQHQRKNNAGVVFHDKTVHVSLEDDGGPDGSNLKTRDHDISVATDTCQQVPDGVLGNNHMSSMIQVSDNQESFEIQEKSFSPSNALDVDVDIDIHGRVCQEPKESNTSSLDTNTDITGAEFPALRPCNANLHQPDSSNIQGDQCVDPNLSNENTTRGSEETSAQGVTPNASEKITGQDVMRGSTSDEGVHVAVGKSNDKVDNRILRDSPVENMNVSAAADFTAPEKLLSVTEVPADLLRNLIMDSTPSGLTRNDGDAGSSVISGRKRSYAESTLIEQSLNSIDSSRLVRSKRTVESIPDDDDLLSSILVGQKSVLKIKPTPPAWEITSVKRRTPATRISANKRKTLMDDMMVLHGDTIREQLLNTEDIRRVRRKAPCTQSEISKIQKQFLGDEIFIEPIYTCVSIELTSLHNQVHDLSGIRISLDDVNSSGLKLSTNHGDNNEDLHTENATDSSALYLTKESEKEGTIELQVVTEDGKRETVETPIDESKLDEDHSVSLDVSKLSSWMKSNTDIETNSSLNEHPEDVTEMDIDGRTPIAELPGADESSLPSDQVLGEGGDISAAHVAEINGNSDVMVQKVEIETCKVNVPMSDEAPDISHDEKIIGASQEMDATTGGEIVECDSAAGKACDPAPAFEAEHQTGYGELSVGSQGTVETTADGRTREAEYNFHGLVNKGVEQSMVDSSFTGEHGRHVENILLDDGNHPVEEVFNPLRAKDDAEISFVHDHDALDYSSIENETEFLNVDDDDDDDFADPTEDNLDNEEAQIMDNSGWSSRTRSVANYLKNLFVKQAGNTKLILSMDNLLVGKTSKEASRMFFEALVLKTKDYIHVEQVVPYETIAIKPRTKLLKSDF